MLINQNIFSKQCWDLHVLLCCCWAVSYAYNIKMCVLMYTMYVRGRNGYPNNVWDVAILCETAQHNNLYCVMMVWPL